MSLCVSGRIVEPFFSDEQHLGLKHQALDAAPWIDRWQQTHPETSNRLGEGRPWPLWHLKGLGKSLRRAGQSYCFVVEEGHLPGGMKRLVMRDLFVRPNARLTRNRSGAACPSPLVD